DTEIYIATVSGPQALAADLETFGAQGPRYLLLASWEARAGLLEAVRAAGYVAQPVCETANRFGERSFTLYRLEPVILDDRER
ncbi:MAG: hypothetical protein ACFB51_19300, partial [Anaerolineae bacterium]